jgi:hypothetical protein
MPSNRNTNDPNRPIEDDDLIGAVDDADEAEIDDAEDEDDDIVDEEDDEDDEDEDDEEEMDEDDEDEGGIEAVAFRTGPTAEVGGEGGGPGEAVERIRARAGLGRGSEATTTWEGGRDGSRVRYDENGMLIKLPPAPRAACGCEQPRRFPEREGARARHRHVGSGRRTPGAARTGGRRGSLRAPRLVGRCRIDRSLIPTSSTRRSRACMRNPRRP